MTPETTRRESIRKVDRAIMYRGIREVLSDGKAYIAEEIAYRMKARGYMVEPNRQGIQPRCTELVEKDILVEDGAARNPRTGKMNVRYRLYKEDE